MCTILFLPQSTALSDILLLPKIFLKYFVCRNQRVMWRESARGAQDLKLPKAFLNQCQNLRGYSCSPEDARLLSLCFAGFKTRILCQ